MITRTTERGDICSIIKTNAKPIPSFDRQKYKPVSYVFDDEIKEWVSVYFHSGPNLPTTGGGAQCIWLRNNAQIDDVYEFGIKLTSMNLGASSAKIAAYAMYQRQQLAAKHGLAPCVHGMCCFKWYDVNDKSVQIYWGYLTSIADTDSCDFPINENAEHRFNKYCKELQHIKDEIDSVASILDGITTGRQYTRIMENIYEELDYVDPDRLDFHDWCNDNDENPYDFDGLREGLNDLSIQGLQHDYQPIGSVYPDGAMMGGDLHYNNVGLWQGDLVCIDFGYHCVENAGRNDYVKI